MAINISDLQSRIQTGQLTQDQAYKRALELSGGLAQEGGTTEQQNYAKQLYNQLFSTAKTYTTVNNTTVNPTGMTSSTANIAPNGNQVFIPGIGEMTSEQARTYGYVPPNNTDPSRNTVYQGGQAMPARNIDGSLVNASNVGKTSPIPTSNPPVVDYSGTFAGAVAGANTSTTTSNTSTAPVDTSSKSVMDRVKELTGLYKTAPSQADAYLQAEQDAQIKQKEQKVNDLTASLNAISASAEASRATLEQQAGGKGVTTEFLGRQAQEINRQASIKALPIAAELSAAQGNLQTAQSHLDTLFKLKMADATAQTDQWNKAVDMAYDMFSKDEQRQIDAMKTERATNQSNLANAVNNNQVLAMEALKNGNTAAYKALTSLVQPNTSSSTFAQDLANYNQKVAEAGSTIVSQSAITEKLQQDNLRSNAVTGILQQEKLRNEIAAGKPPTGEFADVINGATSLVSGTMKQGIKTTLSSALASGDYTTAYASIANAVAEGLTGTNKTKFEDARTDLNVMSGMKDAIEAYVNAGGNINYLKGTADNLTKNFGVLSTDPKFAALGVQLTREFQSYRNNMTGAAFGAGESREYTAVNPRTNASLDLNLTTIDGAMAQLINRISSTINSRVPSAEKIYNKIIPSSVTTTSSTSTTPVTSGSFGNLTWTLE